MRFIQVLSKALPIALILVLLPQIIACQSLPALRKSSAWHGRTPIAADYQFGILSTELPPGYPIETVNAAIKQVLHRQGHIIEEASVTPQGGKIIALANQQLPYDKVKITTAFRGAGVTMSINIDPAEENRARVVLESILLALDL